MFNPYAGAPNPPPNWGSTFNPAFNAAAGAAAGEPDREARADGRWLDDNGGDWSAGVTWNLHDHDIAVIDVSSLAVSYISGLTSAGMAIGVAPSGRVTMVGLSAQNQIRFEPNVRGRFVKVVMGSFDPLVGAVSASVVDLNPHLTYATPSVAVAQRNLSLGDPRAIAWNGAGSEGFVAGMGSGTIARIDAAGGRLGQIEAGVGITGLALCEAAGRIYALNRFTNTLSAFSLASGSAVQAVALHDPEPANVRAGRFHLFDTHATSGLGQAACGSCHIDARFDQLAWDLGNPAGSLQSFDQFCFASSDCTPWHPMKGPMTTQSLVGANGSTPLHWRGDRGNLAAFNRAFVSLNGADAVLSSGDMNDMTAYVGSIAFPPNPHRNFDASLATSFPNGGNPATGHNLFNVGHLFGGIECVTCHSGADGASDKVIAGVHFTQTQNFNVASLSNLYKKAGADFASASGRLGFGFRTTARRTRSSST